MFNKVLTQFIVTDYRLNANHNSVFVNPYTIIVTDYRLNANHNCQCSTMLAIVTDYRLNANHNYVLVHSRLL
ncbi:Helicase loader DnaI [uncultured Gammaproteobacteria bacterium]|nr:Helicase loader DnaI [uncultured Gammaproteobacteria bacterium]